MTGWTVGRGPRGGLVVPGPPPPVTTKPWFGHIDNRDRGGPSSGTGFTAFDGHLAQSRSVSGPVGMFEHGYSGTSYPSSFNGSSVSGAPGRGIGAMLNVKIADWQGIADGDYDSQMVGLFNTWPVDTPGTVTLNHEPENDGPSPANPSNSSYVTWANANAPAWSTGIGRWINVVAPIIRSRGLNVKVGACLMDFSWDTTRWQFWQWWNDPLVQANLDVVDFGIDAYVKMDNVGGLPVGHDLMPRINETVAVMRAAGIESYSLYETAVDRRWRNNGDAYVSDPATNDTVNQTAMTAWWDNYAARLSEIPEMRMVCYFHLPTGPASAQAWMTGSTIGKYADICLNGRRTL